MPPSFNAAVVCQWDDRPSTEIDAYVRCLSLPSENYAPLPAQLAAEAFGQTETPSAAGRTIGHYKLLERVGTGAADPLQSTRGPEMLWDGGQCSVQCQVHRNLADGVLTLQGSADLQSWSPVAEPAVSSGFAFSPRSSACPCGAPRSTRAPPMERRY